MIIKKSQKAITLLAISSLVLVGCSSTAEPEAMDEDVSEETTSQESPEECTPAHEDLETVEEGFLTVAAYEYPPFSIIEGDRISGAEGEILYEIADLECLELKVLPGNGAAMLPSIQSGRADTTLGGWYRTKAGEEILRLSNPVIIDQMTFISVDGTDSVSDLEGKKVGSTLGFLWNIDLGELLGDDLILYETSQALFSDLASGRLDVVVDTKPSGTAALEKTPVEGAVFNVPPADDRVGATTKPGQTNFPVNLDNPGLQEAINDNLDTLREQGVLGEIAEKWGFAPELVAETTPNLL